MLFGTIPNNISFTNFKSFTNITELLHFSFQETVPVGTIRTMSIPFCKFITSFIMTYCSHCR